jgi:hypothetical protein
MRIRAMMVATGPIVKPTPGAAATCKKARAVTGPGLRFTQLVASGDSTISPSGC